MADEDNKEHDGYSIIVNTNKMTVATDDVSYEEVTKLAYPTPPAPNTKFTVNYRRAKLPPHEGSLVAGQSVEVRKEGTIFDVTPTAKS